MGVRFTMCLSLIPGLRLNLYGLIGMLAGVLQ